MDADHSINLSLGTHGEQYIFRGSLGRLDAFETQARELADDAESPFDHRDAQVIIETCRGIADGLRESQRTARS